jgi:hypothetical protein
LKLKNLLGHLNEVSVVNGKCKSVSHNTKLSPKNAEDLWVKDLTQTWIH